MGHRHSWLSSSASPTLYTAQQQARLRVKSNVEGVQDGGDPTICDFLKARCPSLFAPYTPTWYLNSGHLQTAYCVAGDFSQVDRVVYDRTLIRLKDGGTLGLDSTPPANERTIPDDTPIIVVKHGLSGGSHESYVRAILAQAVKPAAEGGLGYRGIVVNFRGCAGVTLTSGQLYSAAETNDLRQAIVYIAQKYPNAPLYGLGFSLGANVVVRYLAEEGDRCRLRAACVLGCPWDLLANSIRLQENFFLRNIYAKTMASNLKKVGQINRPAVDELSDIRLKPVFDKLFSQERRLTLWEFDGLVTANVGGSPPAFPHESAEAYYRYGSSHKCLDSIRVPLLALNAEDDPIIGHFPHEVGNGLVVIAATEGGGHLGWFESSKDGSLRRWVTKPVIEWLRAVGEDYNPPSMKFRQIVQNVEWTTEEGREELGFKVLGDAGQVKGTEGEGGLVAGL